MSTSRYFDDQPTISMQMSQWSHPLYLLRWSAINEVDFLWICARIMNIEIDSISSVFVKWCGQLVCSISGEIGGVGMILQRLEHPKKQVKLLVLLPGFQKGRDIKASYIVLRKRAGSSFGQKRPICIVQGKTWKMEQNFTTFRVNKMFSHKF
jgi:hypothetical protein